MDVNCSECHNTIRPHEHQYRCKHFRCRNIMCPACNSRMHQLVMADIDKLRQIINEDPDEFIACSRCYQFIKTKFMNYLR